MISAFVSPTRREILALIWEREAPAGQIATAFSLSKPTISQHLAVLRQAGLVTALATGTSRRYHARQEALTGLHAALGSPGKWSNADEAPERALADASTKLVVVGTDIGTSQAVTFAAFTDPAMYSRWLGVPATIEEGVSPARWSEGRGSAAGTSWSARPS
jgi:DNA-binding transcriptional ArsR family regulator